jgi:hypothetical protein
MLINLFQGLIWPAVAGNVAWAFFSVAVSEDWDCTVCARLTALSLVALYLILDWMRGEAVRAKLIAVKSYWWVADLLLACAIATFAIATQDRNVAPKRWVDWSLAAIFAVAACGHLAGVWEGVRKDWRSFVRMNGLGAGVVLLVPVLGWNLCLWHRPVAVALVVAWWICLRWDALWSALTGTVPQTTPIDRSRAGNPEDAGAEGAAETDAEERESH